MTNENNNDHENNKCVVLIGMPGAGKSTAGVVLAKKLGYRFIDSDLLIQEEEGRLLPQIIDEDGIDGFLAIEDSVNSRIRAERSVIATGGSVIYGEKAMKHLGEIGTIVYLKQSYLSIEKRVKNLTGRGVAVRSGQTLKDLYEERCPLYEKYAQITVDTEGLDLAETVDRIEEGLKK